MNRTAAVCEAPAAAHREIELLRLGLRPQPRSNPHRFMVPMRVQSWTSRLAMNRTAAVCEAPAAAHRKIELLRLGLRPQPPSNPHRFMVPMRDSGIVEASPEAQD